MTTSEPTSITRSPWPFSACPDCGGHDFAVTPVDDDVVFTCRGCAASWRYLLGYLVSVAPPSAGS